MIIKRFLNFIASAIFVAAFIIMLLLTDVQLAAFNRDYYYKQYEKYQVPQSIGISMPDLLSSTDILLNYMDGKRDNLDFQKPIKGVEQEFFSDRDKLHMIDVKGLVIRGKTIRNIAFWYSLIFIIMFLYKAGNRKKSSSKLLILTSAAGIIPIVLLAILMKIDFYKYFTVFHEIFFINDLWQLDPLKDRLINMFPEAFFTDIAFKIVYYYVIELATLLVIGISMLKYKERNIQLNK